MNRILSFTRRASLAASASLMLGACSLVEVRQEPMMFFVAGEVDTAEHQKLVSLMLQEIEQFAIPSVDLVNVNYMVNDGVVNVYGSYADKQAIYSVIKTISTLENTDQGLVSINYRLLDIAEQNPEKEIQAIFISDGTTDEVVIAALAGANEKLSEYENVSISVLGVDPSKRAAFSKAFAPIPAQITFAGSSEELATKFRSIGG